MNNLDYCRGTTLPSPETRPSRREGPLNALSLPSHRLSRSRREHSRAWPLIADERTTPMHSTSRSLTPGVVLPLVVCALLGSAVPASARKVKPEPCPPARYIITSQPIVTSPSGPQTSGLTVGASTSIEPFCSPVQTKLRKANQKGVTHVVAVWASCDRINGKVRLDGNLFEECTRFKGKVKAKKLSKPVVGVLSRCGDGIIDTGGGEKCDDGNTVSGDGCDSSCLP